ncbi:hypothetical protein DE146DRAFT_111907 [Phaeosphaeria sp. MPI-PUGE-AT-0046c]|nr:hypothetical protein DE146DRAFT_111907 [Phaeosphaeria sp. MPI-PUGE-AT-0046c]
MRVMSHKVKWALKDLNDAVGKEQDGLRGPLQAVSLLLQMQAIKTVRATNEKCQRIVDDIEASDFAKSLQRELKSLRQHGDETRDHQDRFQTNLTQLKRSLNLQHSEILAALQEDRKVRKTTVQTGNPLESEQNVLLVSLLGNSGILHGREDAFEIIQGQLRAQQACLDNLHELLQYLATDVSKTTETVSSPMTDVQDKVGTTDMMALLGVTATAASMFMLGFSSISTPLRNFSIAPFTVPKESQARSRLDVPKHSEASTDQEESRATEFTRGHKQQDRSAETHHSPNRSSHDDESALPPARHGMTRFDWHCCQRDRGPYPQSRSTCWGCWTIYCQDCPRTALATTENASTEAPGHWDCCKCGRLNLFFSCMDCLHDHCSQCPSVTQAS